MRTYLQLFRSQGLKLVNTYFWNAHLFDLINGTDTHSMRKQEDLESSLENLDNAVSYMVSWSKTLRETQQILKKISDYSEERYFVDYGCGKGKVILWSLKNDILNLGHRYLGIDFDPSLIEIAKKNAIIMNLDPKNFVHANVLNFHRYPAKEISFLYNPFDHIVIVKLLETLTLRSEYVIYVNPVHRNLFLNAGFKSFIRKKSWHANLSYELFHNGK